MNSRCFVPKLLRYIMCWKVFQSFGKVIAKTKGCSFLGHSVFCMRNMTWHTTWRRVGLLDELMTLLYRIYFGD